MANPQPLTEVEWGILRKLVDDKLTWGAAVGACWKNLVRHGYVQPGFGDITEAGRRAVEEHQAELYNQPPPGAGS